MKKLMILSCLTLFLTQMTLAQDKCEAPVWNVGDKWVYKDATGESWVDEVVDIKDDLFIVKSERSEDLAGYEKKTLNQKFLIEKSGKKIKSTISSRKLFDFPIFTGKKWTDLTTVTHSRTGTQSNIIQDFKIEGMEKIKTPAGAFDTYIIHYKQTNTQSMASGWVRYWYSPEVKTWVKREYEKSGFWPPGARWVRDAELIACELK